jgi:pimeloyl-ACP methyl ester carboxylesterase
MTGTLAARGRQNNDLQGHDAMTSDGIETTTCAVEHARLHQRGAHMQRRNFVKAAAVSVAGLGLSDVSLAGGAPVARRYVDTRFGRIAHVDRGSGEAVLFLHGFPLNSFQWRDSIKLLSAERRCLAPDFLGLGHTEVADGVGCGPLDQVAMLMEFLDAKSIAAVDLIASDSGGAVAQHLVVRHPERVRTLLLANCDTEIDYPVAVLQPIFELAKKGRFADAVIAAWLADKNAARKAPAGLGDCYSTPDKLNDEMLEQYLAPLVATSAKKQRLHDYCLALEANPLAGIEPDLRACRVPTRIVWGADDRIFSTKSPEYLAKIFGNSRGLRMLDGYKLFWPEERPDVVVEEARKLWS